MGTWRNLKSPFFLENLEMYLVQKTFRGGLDGCMEIYSMSLSGVPDYFGRNKISSGGDLSHYSSASLY